LTRFAVCVSLTRGMNACNCATTDVILHLHYFINQALRSSTVQRYTAFTSEEMMIQFHLCHTSKRNDMYKGKPKHKMQISHLWSSPATSDAPRDPPSPTPSHLNPAPEFHRLRYHLCIVSPQLFCLTYPANLRFYRCQIPSFCSSLEIKRLAYSTNH